MFPLSFSPDGNTLATGSWDESVRLWDVTIGVHLHTFRHRAGVNSVSFSPDGNTLACGDAYEVRLWDADTGAEIDISYRSVRDVKSISFSPDGNTLAAGATRWSNRAVYLWNAQTGALQHTLSGPRGVVNSVSFSPDGITIASGSSNAVYLWNVQTGALQHTLTGHTGVVNSVSFSPDGITIASGSDDSTVRLWNAQTGAPQHTLTGHTGVVNSVSFSPVGSTLATGSLDGTVLLWELNPSTTPTQPPSTAPAPTVSISPSSVPAPAVGEQLTFSLNIADGENVAGYQATVRFDTTALRYVESANGDYLPADAFFVPPVVSDSSVTLAATSLSGESSGGGTLATLTFEVVTVKASTLTLFRVLLSDGAGARFLPLIENGKILKPELVKGDINGDGVVDTQDLMLLAGYLGQSGADHADVNEDGVVNIQDLVLAAGALGNEAAAPTLHPHALGRLTASDVQEWLIEAQQMGLTDPVYLRGIAMLEQLLATLTPKKTALLPNYPNPFNPETWIPYHLAHPADVTLMIYDTQGGVVRRLSLGHQSAGYYTDRSKAAYWDGRNERGESVVSGVYFYELRVDTMSLLRKMVILK